MTYTTEATTSGGRDGRAVLEQDKLALAMALPKDMGGSGAGHNPEQLFALGWSSCFGQAVLALRATTAISPRATHLEPCLRPERATLALSRYFSFLPPPVRITILRIKGRAVRG